MTGGNHHCQGVRAGQGTEGTQAEARDRGILKALRRQMEPDRDLGRAAEGGTVWRPSPWASFSKTPGEGAKK